MYWTYALEDLHEPHGGPDGAEAMGVSLTLHFYRTIERAKRAAEDAVCAEYEYMFFDGDERWEFVWHEGAALQGLPPTRFWLQVKHPDDLELEEGESVPAWAIVHPISLEE